MSSLTQEQLAVISQEPIVSYVNTDFLRERLDDFVDKNNLGKTNYTSLLLDDNCKLLRELGKTMNQFCTDEIIDKHHLSKTVITHYSKIKPWVEKLLEKKGKPATSISAKEHFDYCKTSLLCMIGIRIIEKILDVD